MNEVKTLPGLSVHLDSSSAGFHAIQPSVTRTAVVGFEHVKSLLVSRPLKRRSTQRRPKAANLVPPR